MIVNDKEYGEFEVYLVGDGTLDTVIMVYHSFNPKGFEFRFSQEYVAEFRDNNGAMTDSGFEQLANEAIEAYIEQYLC